MHVESLGSEPCVPEISQALGEPFVENNTTLVRPHRKAAKSRKFLLAWSDFTPQFPQHSDSFIVDNEFRF